MMKGFSSRKQLVIIDKDKDENKSSKTTNEDDSFEHHKIKYYSKLDYSIDDYNNNFYLWLEHLCIPIKNKVKLEANGYSAESSLVDVRKEICTAVNDPPDRYYDVRTYNLEWYLEKNNIPIEQVYMSKKLYASRIKAINLMGRTELFEYYEQGTIPPTCIE